MDRLIKERKEEKIKEIKYIEMRLTDQFSLNNLNISLVWQLYDLNKDERRNSS